MAALVFQLGGIISEAFESSQSEIAILGLL